MGRDGRLTGYAFVDDQSAAQEDQGCLNRRYEPPAFGFVASKKSFELGEASMTLRQGCRKKRGHCRQYPVRSEGAFVGHNYSLGLDKALDIIKAIECGD